VPLKRYFRMASGGFSPEGESFEETRIIKAIEVGSPPKDIDDEVLVPFNVAGFKKS